MSLYSGLGAHFDLLSSAKEVRALHWIKRMETVEQLCWILHFT